jgi:hypothetical protein
MTRRRQRQPELVLARSPNLTLPHVALTNNFVLTSTLLPRLRTTPKRTCILRPIQTSGSV